MRTAPRRPRRIALAPAILIVVATLSMLATTAPATTDAGPRITSRLAQLGDGTCAGDLRIEDVADEGIASALTRVEVLPGCHLAVVHITYPAPFPHTDVTLAWVNATAGAATDPGYLALLSKYDYSQAEGTCPVARAALRAEDSRTWTPTTPLPEGDIAWDQCLSTWAQTWTSSTETARLATTMQASGSGTRHASYTYACEYKPDRVFVGETRVCTFTSENVPIPEPTTSPS